MIDPNFDYEHVQKHIHAGIQEGWLYLDEKGKARLTEKGKQEAMDIILMDRRRRAHYNKLQDMHKPLYAIYELLCQLEVFACQESA